MLKNPAAGHRQLMFENCEQRLLLTDACSATEPISSEEPIAEVAPSDANTVTTDDEITKLEGAADVTQEILNDPKTLIVHVTIDIDVPKDDLGIDLPDDPTADSSSVSLNRATGQMDSFFDVWTDL